MYTVDTKKVYILFPYLHVTFAILNLLQPFFAIP